MMTLTIYPSSVQTPLPPEPKAPHCTTPWTDLVLDRTMNLMPNMMCIKTVSDCGFDIRRREGT